MAQITLSIPDEQWPDFQNYFLKRLPVLLENDVPTMSVVDWIKKSIVDNIYQILLEGKQMSAFDEIEIDITLT